MEAGRHDYGVLRQAGNPCSRYGLMSADAITCTRQSVKIGKLFLPITVLEDESLWRQGFRSWMAPWSPSTVSLTATLF